MPLKPEQVRARGFRVALFGYRKRDVRSFLRRVAWDYKTSLEASSGRGPAVTEAREVERLLRSTQEATELLRLVAELEAKREQAGPEDDALAAYRLLTAAEVLSAAADALERAHRVVACRREVTSPPLQLETERSEVIERSGNQAKTAPLTQIALASPPPPPVVSSTLQAPG
jgi:DivIVA domain-containing protein